eukprot:gene8183-803_t
MGNSESLTGQARTFFMPWRSPASNENTQSPSSFDPSRDAVPLHEQQFQECIRELEIVRVKDPWLMRDLRSDHAGEVGAVWIYNGAMAAMRMRNHSPEVQAFVEHHLEAEQGHLAFFEQSVNKEEHTKLVPMWKIMGYCLGFFPTLLGAKPLFLTIYAVETFVEDHYNSHIRPLEARNPNPYPILTHALKQFCADEVSHAEDAAHHFGIRGIHGVVNGNGLAAGWCKLVRWGSARAADLARRF